MGFIWRSRYGAGEAQISALPVSRRFIPVGNANQPSLGRVLMIGTGAAITIIALILAWAASHVLISTYLILALLGGGPLLLTWPTRAERHGRFPYSLAIVVTAVCALWATGLYAHSTGIRNAQAFVRNLPSGTAVVVYSVQRLAMGGAPGVISQPLGPGALYHYEYQGLRLLLFRSGTYYLVPVGWNPRQDHTYVFRLCRWRSPLPQTWTGCTADRAPALLRCALRVIPARQPHDRLP